MEEAWYVKTTITKETYLRRRLLNDWTLLWMF